MNQKNFIEFFYKEFNTKYFKIINPKLNNKNSCTGQFFIKKFMNYKNNNEAINQIYRK